MRVLIPVDHAVGVTGPHRNVVGSLNALSARDDVDVVLCTGRVDQDEPYAYANNINTRLGFSPHDPRRLLSNVWMLHHAAQGCDVVYVPSGLKALLLAQTVRAGRKLVAGPNVSHFPVGVASKHDSPGRFQITKLCDAWIEPSLVRQKHVASISGVSTVSYVHHAIDLEKFSPDHRDAQVRERIGIPPSAVMLVFAGRDNEARKGVSQLLDAMALLCQMPQNKPIHLVIAGNLSSATMRRVNELPNVHSAGFLRGKALPALYASADMAVIPSSWETFGFTVLEAMACGLPVISTYAGSIPEIMTDGVTGLLLDIVSPGGRHRENAPEVIADAIVRLASNAEERARMGAAARERAVREFSEERLGNDLVALFRGEYFPRRCSS